MSADFIPVLMHLLLVAGVAAFILAGSVLLGRSGRKNEVKDTAYECGMPAGVVRAPRYSVKFYLVAMLFVLFDIEVIFLYPWAVQFREMVAESLLPLWSMVFFVLILGIAYLYVLKKKALDWNEA